jgi:hypothetical protein
MNTPVKVSILVAVSVVLVSSGYALLLNGLTTQPPTSEDNDQDNNELNDTLAPTITSITGDLKGDAGSTITITTTFFDNVAVTSAKLYYRPATALAWSSKSILSGSANLPLPAGSNESWYYYVTVNDAAGNGPVGNPSVDGSSYYTIKVLNTNTIPPDDNDTNNGGSNNNQNTTRFVFVELGTKIVCSVCPKISAIINELYDSGTLPFYYVSLPIDNPKTAERLKEYNLYGTPTAYIDGGYNVLFGSKLQKSDFEKNITVAAARTTPKVFVNTTASWNNHTNIITVAVHVESQEETVYNGRLRVYETELISTKWQAGTPEHFSFLDFLINQDIQIDAKSNLTLTNTMNTADLDPENLMLFSVIFNDEKHSGYSQPPDKNPFDVHVVDAVSATRVVKGGNLPPEVGIQNPVVKTFHRFGKPLRGTLTGKTVLLGKTPIVVSTHDDSKIVKVEFYLNNKLMATVTQEPYQWVWHKFALGKRIISVKAYDDTGKIAVATMNVVAFIL